MKIRYTAAVALYIAGWLAAQVCIALAAQHQHKYAACSALLMALILMITGILIEPRYK